MNSIEGTDSEKIINFDFLHFIWQHWQIFKKFRVELFMKYFTVPNSEQIKNFRLSSISIQHTFGKVSFWSLLRKKNINKIISATFGWYFRGVGKKGHIFILLVHHYLLVHLGPNMLPVNFYWKFWKIHIAYAYFK